MTSEFEPQSTPLEELKPVFELSGFTGRMCNARLFKSAMRYIDQPETPKHLVQEEYISPDDLSDYQRGMHEEDKKRLKELDEDLANARTDDEKFDIIDQQITVTGKQAHRLKKKPDSL